jgi:hypothetical protein
MVLGRFCLPLINVLMLKKEARVTTADAEQTAVAAFRPWRDSSVHIPWALANLGD